MPMWGSLNMMNIPLCPNCGGKMGFSKENEYKCIDCGHTQSLEKTKLERTHEDLGPRIPKHHEIDTPRHHKWD